MYVFPPPLYMLYAPPNSFFSTQHTKTTEESILKGDIFWMIRKRLTNW
jgi:hypothetical protein